MRTVPLPVAATLLANHPALHAQLRPAGILIGSRTEIDVDALAASNPRLSALLWSYSQACRSLWAAARAGRPGGPYVATRRTLIEHVQRNTKSAKVDLPHVMEALTGLDTIGQVITEALKADPDVPAIAAWTQALAGQCVAEPGVLTLSFPVEGQVDFPDELGGPAGFGEVRRMLTVVVRHAAWRDRQVRRLARVVVEADELFADPTPAAVHLRAAA